MKRTHLLQSVRILLAWAAVKYLEIFQFDRKTAFLHAKIRHPLYARPFPCYPISEPGKYLRILVALYGLRQSAYEFYILIMLLLEWYAVKSIMGYSLECGPRHLIHQLICHWMATDLYSISLNMLTTDWLLPTLSPCMIGS